MIVKQDPLRIVRRDETDRDVMVVDEIVLVHLSADVMRVIVVPAFFQG